MPIPIGRVALGLALSGVIAAISYRREALSASGAGGAVLTGTVIFGLGGWDWGLLLITFFVLSTVMSRIGTRAKVGVAEKYAKGSRRDIGQVMANGGAGALLAVAASLRPTLPLFIAFSGAMATVNGDTWATELGVLSKRPPRLITTGREVLPGTSGGVSVLGTSASLAGSGVIGLSAALFSVLFGNPSTTLSSLGLVSATAVGGLIGSLFDSLLGATVQVIYFSHQRKKETERPREPDGTQNVRIRGWRWLNNDWVNFLSSLVGAAAAAAVYGWLA